MPGFGWKNLLAIGRSVAGMFVPGLEASILAVENAVDVFRGDNRTGAEKKQAAIAAATQVVRSIEGGAGADILNDPRVVDATGHFVDAYVSAMNARQSLIDAIGAAQEARNPPASDSGGATAGSGS